MAEDYSDILRALGRVEGKLEGISSDIKNNSTKLESLDVRVKALEHAKAWLLGASAVVGASASYIIKFLTGGGAP